ncbi:MAG: hypothetical protein FJ139_10920 [Deltaproteobacteria bacterium]|nr:hypothetical protein [Deltaproteobacteria bacterium]
MDPISKNVVGGLQGGRNKPAEEAGGGNILIDGRVLKADDRVYDLVDVVEDLNEGAHKKDQEIIVIDGRVYERVSKPGDQVYDLMDVEGEGSAVPVSVADINERIMKRVDEITEKIVREMVPDIAERIIREEIEKLKK